MKADMKPKTIILKYIYLNTAAEDENEESRYGVTALSEGVKNPKSNTYDSDKATKASYKG